MIPHKQRAAVEQERDNGHDNRDRTPFEEPAQDQKGDQAGNQRAGADVIGVAAEDPQHDATQHDDLDRNDPRPGARPGQEEQQDDQGNRVGHDVSQSAVQEAAS